MLVINSLSNSEYGILYNPSFLDSPSAHLRVNLAGDPGRKKLSFRANIAISPSVIDEYVTNAAPLCVPFRSLITYVSNTIPKF